MDVRIGCSGWVYPCWKGGFYPKDLPQKEWFSFYANHFNTLEINNTFYRFPTVKMMNKWYEQAPQGFNYSLKVNRLITHVKRFKDVVPELQDFYQLGAILKEKMGAFLFQMPPSFVYTPENLQTILESLNKAYLNVIEFRHPSWWNADVYQLFSDNNIVFCSVSAPGLPDELLSFNNTIYFRFHGIPWYSASYTEKELLSWMSRMWQARAKNLWVYFNNTAAGYAPLNALRLKDYFRLT